MPVAPTPILERAWSKFTAGPGCWEWQASTNDSGYGQISRGRGKPPERAHRLIYEALVGPIPEGLDLDHLCRNRSCVNPDHLEPVTRGENVRRGNAPEATSLRAAEQTHCKRGHEFTPANTYLQSCHGGKYTSRLCRKCRALRARGYRK